MKEEMSVSSRIETNKIASLMNYFTEDEIKRILSVLHEREDRLLFLLGLELGARVSEISSLEWANINWQNKYIVVWDEKKNRHRVCTIPESLWAFLREYSKEVDKRKEKVVFDYSDKTLNRRIKAWALAAGVQRRVRWHMLRHTYVVQSRRKGRDWNLISVQTGDSIAMLIETYSKLSLEDRVKITDETAIVEHMEEMRE